MIKSEKLQRYISTDLGEVCLADNVTELEAVNDELWQAIKALTTNHEAARKEWEAKEKALRELANEWASFSWAPFMNPAARLKAILEREQEKP